MKQPDYQKRFEHVENWYLESKTGVVHVGSPERLLIVGESLPKSGLPLRSKADKRLVEALGFEHHEDLLDAVDYVSLLPRYPGRTKSGNLSFSVRQACVERERLRFAADHVLLLGRAAKVCGVYELWANVRIPKRDGYLGQCSAMAVLSLRDPWWKEPESVLRAREALESRAAFARTGR